MNFWGLPSIILPKLKKAFSGFCKAACRSDVAVIGGIAPRWPLPRFLQPHGELMFSVLPNASKAALSTLVGHLRQLDFDLIDCQIEPAHIRSLHARLIPRREFSEPLSASLMQETLRESWGKLF